MSHFSPHLPARSMFRRAGRLPLALVATAALLVACGGSDDADDDPASDAAAADTATDDAATDEAASDDAATDEAEPEAPADDADTSGGGGGLTGDDVGSGLVRIDGVEFTDFRGDCEITRGFGVEDVGDVSTPGISVIVAVDNVASGPTEEQNFVMINEETFRVVNVPGDVASIAEIGPRTSSGSRDYVPLRFTGTLEDGRAVEAEIVCTLQNQF